VKIEKLWQDISNLFGSGSGTKTTTLCDTDYLIIHSYHNYFNVVGSNLENRTTIKFVITKEWKFEALWSDGKFPVEYRVVDVVINGKAELSNDGKFMEKINAFLLPYLRESKLSQII
jgi:hypothetical protein